MESLAADLRQMVRTPLHPEHVEAMRAEGREMSVAAGETVIALGAPYTDFYYVLEGELEIVDPFTGERALPAGLGPSQFAGEIAFLSGVRSTTHVRAARDSRLLAVPRAAMLALMAATPEMSDIVITVFAARRRRQIESSADASLTFVGLDDHPALRETAAFARRNRLPFRTVDLGSAEAAAVARACGAAQGAPLVVYGRDTVLDAPSPAALARLVGLDLGLGDGDASADVLIVGAGPRASPRRSMPAPRACRRSWSTPSAPGGRRARRAGSRTTWAFPPASRAATWCGAARFRR